MALIDVGAIAQYSQSMPYDTCVSIITCIIICYALLRHSPTSSTACSINGAQLMLCFSLQLQILVADGC